MRIFEEKIFFSKFCIVDAALQNGNILGCNNSTETIETAIKSVDEEVFEKLNIQGPFEYSTSPETTQNSICGSNNCQYCNIAST